MILNYIREKSPESTCLVEIAISLMISVGQYLWRFQNQAFLTLITIPLIIIPLLIKSKSVILLVLIGTQALYLEVFLWIGCDKDQDWLVSFAAFYIGRAFVSSRLLLSSLDKSVFFLIILPYLIGRLKLYSPPYVYAVAFYMLLLVRQDFVKKQQLLKIDKRRLKESQGKEKFLQQQQHQLLQFIHSAIPLQLCIFSQKSIKIYQYLEEILFHTKQLEQQFYVKDFTNSIAQLEVVQQFLRLPLPSYIQAEQYQLYKVKEILSQSLIVQNCEDKIMNDIYSNGEIIISDNIAFDLNSQQDPFKMIQEHNQFLQPDVNSNYSQELQLDFKLAHCNWKGQSAVLIILNDVTRLQTELELLKRQDICKDNILASVSHDFKTPINGVVQIIEHLESHIVKDEQVLYYLKIIKQSNDLLLFMIYDILDYARIIKNQLRLCPSSFILNNIIQEVIELLRMPAQQKHIQLIQTSRIQSHFMYSDPNRLKQILLNLLSNALKYTEKGSIEVIIEPTFPSQTFPSQLSLKSIKTNEPLIKITVKDSGVGIPEPIRAKLFNMYATFDHAKGSNMDGVGLGLSICKKLVGLLGPTDEIKITTEVGLGSAFSFIIYETLSDSNHGQSDPSRYVSVLKEENQMSLTPHRQNSLYFSSSQIMIFNRQRKISQVHQAQSMKLQHISSFNDMQSKPNFMPCTFSQIKVNIERNIEKNTLNSLPEEDQDGYKNQNINKFKSPSRTKKLMNKTLVLMSKGSFGSHTNPPDLRNRQQCEVQQFQSINLIQDLSSVISQNVPTNQFQKYALENPNYLLEDKHILIVDDEPFNVMAFKTLLQPYAFIDEAFNGRQALNKVQAAYYQKPDHAPYDYIFMDLTMPIMNGYDAAKELKSMMNKNLIPYIPIIALTGFDDIKEKDRCQSVGFDAFISKPVKLQGLVSVLRELLCNMQNE